MGNLVRETGDEMNWSHGTVKWRADVTPPVLGGEDADPEGLLLFFAAKLRVCGLCERSGGI